MKNKRADLTLTEGAKLILSVICIVLLISFAVMLYSALSNKQEREQAKATLEQLTGKIENLQEGKSTDFLITSPIDWYLVYFDSKFDNVPNACINIKEGTQFKTCLCMCPKLDVNINPTFSNPNIALRLEPQMYFSIDRINYFKKNPDKCSKGVCKITEKVLQLPIVSFEQRETGDFMQDMQTFWIFIKPPLPIFLKENSGKILISTKQL